MTTDAALVSRTQHGDEEAFRALYERHRPAVERVCRKWLRDPYLVEDAVQGTFLKAWTALPEFSGGPEVDRWLRRIAKNHCHDLWRSLARAEALGRAEDSVAEQADAGIPRLGGECVDRLAVETMLRNLGRRDASLLVQRHIGEFPVGAMAAQWGLTKGAMDVALHRARLRARRLASAEGLRGLVPIGLLRRVVAAMQRLGTSHGDAGAVLLGVCNIAVAVSLSVPDLPPAYAEEEVPTASPPVPVRVLPARSLPAADKVLSAVLADRPQSGSALGDDAATPAESGATEASPTAPRVAKNTGHGGESYVDFDPVTLPAGGAKISSKPPPREPDRNLVIKPTDTEIEEYRGDGSPTDPAAPVYDAACMAAEAGEPLTSCGD